MSTFQAKKGDKVYAYIMPGFIVYVLAMVVPLIICLGISLTNWRGGPKVDFIGVQNYVRLLKDKNFWSAFLNNIEIIVILMISQIGLGFIMALFYQVKAVKLKEFHRRIIFLPAVLAPIVVGMIWQLVYRDDIGLISGILRVLGIEKEIPWLSSNEMVIPSICLALTWQFVGQFVVIIMAGMQNIGTEVLEAAEIDGAKGWQKACYITFPLLKSTISICILICISGCMKLFDIIFIMSNGGPGNSSMVTALYSYDVAFNSQKLGYASATAIGMTILSLILVTISQRILGGRSEDGNKIS